MNSITKRPPSNQALVAKSIKAFCKGLGIKCKATSDSFSGGDSVRAVIDDQPPEVFNKVEAFANEHQYGSFNGMEDIYEYSNGRKDIPQSKYVFVENHYSDELKQAAWDAIRVDYALQDAPESANEADQYQVWETWGGTFIYRFLRGSLQPVLCVNGDDKDYSAIFWASRKPEVKAVSVSCGESHIEEHTHTKKGFQMFIVILASRVDRDEFNALRDKAQSLGGWYSRKWGTTPAGFAFKQQESAESFLNDAPAPTDPTPTPGLGDKLRTLADKMQGAIDHKFGVRQTNTPKRQREAGSARLDGERLLRAQEGLNKLARLHDSGAVPPVLLGVKTKKAAYDLAKSEIVHAGGYYDAGRCQGIPSSDSPEALAFWELLKGKSEDEKKADTLRELENKLMFSDIPGFFPTPDPLIDQMLERAGIEEGHTVLEPSAGKGSIADRMGTGIDCCEIRGSLCEILELKGHKVLDNDFMTADIERGYDRIVMNPPFEKMQDVDHVLKAFDCLNEGGRIVSIMSRSPFFNSTKKAFSFRAWFDEVGGEQIDIPPGAFKESGTGVSSVLVVIDKD